MPSAFHAAQSNTADDELGKQQVHDDDGQNGDSHHHVNLAHIKLEEVGTAQLGNEDLLFSFTFDLLYNAKAAAFSPGSGLFVPKKAGSRNFTVTARNIEK